MSDKFKNNKKIFVFLFNKFLWVSNSFKGKWKYLQMYATVKTVTTSDKSNTNESIVRHMMFYKIQVPWLQEGFFCAEIFFMLLGVRISDAFINLGHIDIKFQFSASRKDR